MNRLFVTDYTGCAVCFWFTKKNCFERVIGFWQHSLWYILFWVRTVMKNLESRGALKKKKSKLNLESFGKLVSQISV